MHTFAIEGLMAIPATIKLGPDTVPVYGNVPTMVASQSGLWSDAAIWQVVGQAPLGILDDSSVYIPPGVTVTINGQAVAMNIVVAGAIYIPPGSSLRVGTLTVLPSGTLTAEGPSDITIRPQPFDAADPLQWGRGIIVAGTINLSQAVTIDSEVPSVPGHIVIGGDFANATLRGVSIMGMGRTTNEPFSATNQKGRYALHFHHCHGPFPQTVENCFLYGTLSRWGLVIHGTNGGTFTGNQIQGFVGAGIMVEDGTEFGNTIEFNTVSGATGSGQAVYFRSKGIGFDLGHDGAGIWLRNGLNTVFDNTIRGCNKGIALVQIDVGPNHDGLIAGPDGNPLNVNGAPCNIANNTTDGCGVGVFLWEVGARIIGNNLAQVEGDGPFVVDHHTSMNDSTAIECRWTNGVRIESLAARGDGSRKSIGIETNGSDGNTMNRGLMVIDPMIVNCAVAIQAPRKIGLPGEQGTLKIYGGFLGCKTNVEIVGIHPRTVAVKNCALHSANGIVYKPHAKNTAGAAEYVIVDDRFIYRDGSPNMPADAVALPWVTGGKGAAE